MTYKIMMMLLLGVALLPATDPGYMTVTLTNVKPGKTPEYNDLQKKLSDFFESRGFPGNTTQLIRLRRAYPIGAEHGYNRVALGFRPEPAELDLAKEPSFLPEFLKSAGWTPEQYQTKIEGVYHQNDMRGRLYREVVSLGSIQPGDWVRLNWIRSNPGKHVALRDANVKYNQMASKKLIERGGEKAWMLYELPFSTGEKDFDLLRVHVFADSKAAQKQLTGMSSMFPSDEWAKALDAFRGSTETTRIEIFQVERSVTRK